MTARIIMHTTNGTKHSKDYESKSAARYIASRFRLHGAVIDIGMGIEAYIPAESIKKVEVMNLSPYGYVQEV